MKASETHAVITTVWKMESARLIAGLTRLVGDLDLAEDLAQGALVAALEKWPASAVPQTPGAWLMATAKHRAIDELRRHKRLEQKHAELARGLASAPPTSLPDAEEAIDDDIGDDLLRLIFIACHPALSTEARVAPTLRLLRGPGPE